MFLLRASYKICYLFAHMSITYCRAEVQVRCVPTLLAESELVMSRTLLATSAGTINCQLQLATKISDVTVITTSLRFDDYSEQSMCFAG